jgi:hypothetical protein
MMAYFKNIGSASAWSRYSVLKSTLFVFQNVDISISPIGGETGGSENLSTSCELLVCEAGAASKIRVDFQRQLRWDNHLTLYVNGIGSAVLTPF